MSSVCYNKTLRKYNIFSLVLSYAVKQNGKTKYIDITMNRAIGLKSFEYIEIQSKKKYLYYFYKTIKINLLVKLIRFQKIKSNNTYETFYYECNVLFTSQYSNNE